MGMYTELTLKIEVKRKLDKKVEDVLSYLFGGAEDAPEELPEHEFFMCDRWSMIGRGCSFYHHPEALSSYTNGYIFSRSDLKNYDGEIEKFLDWVKPYLEYASEGDCIGWKWYEESDKPDIILV